MGPLISLASNSPRRRQLLAFSGWTFDVHPVDIDETPLPGELPPDYVRRIARAKAADACCVHADGVNAAEGLPAGRIVVAADTTVADGDHILGKPDGPEQAAAMLRRLRGRTHQVFTAIAVFQFTDLPAAGAPLAGGGAGDAIANGHAGEPEILLDLSCTDVPMREYGDDEILSYIATGDPFDKAGGYAIQHAGFRPVGQISGCYANVVGLPICHLIRTLRKMGIAPMADVPAACLEVLGYDCRVHSQILAGGG